MVQGLLLAFARVSSSAIKNPLAHLVLRHTVNRTDVFIFLYYSGLLASLGQGYPYPVLNGCYPADASMLKHT